MLSDSEVVVIHDQEILELYEDGSLQRWPDNLFPARDKVIECLTNFSFDPETITESPVEVMYSSGENEVRVIPELTYENVAGIIGGDRRPYGITLLETIEEGILLAADEYGALRGI